MPQDAPKPPVPVVAATRQRQAALPGVIFDSDMGANIDSALALAVLYGATSKIKLIGLTVSNPSMEAAAFCDVMARFYTTGGKLNTTPPRYHFPIGYAGDGTRKATSGMLTKPLALKAADGTPVFGVNVQELNDTSEVAITLRNALTSQKDGEAVIVCAGPATNLVMSMALPGNKELIAAKTGTLVLAAGAYGSGGFDPRIKTDIASARKLFEEWPSPIVAVGMEAGAAVPYPGSSIASDFAWAVAHPLVEAYKAANPMPYDAPSQAVIAALYATDPKSDLLPLSEPGRIEILEDGRTKFTPSATGKHRYIVASADAAWKDRVVKAMVALASVKPAAPVGREFRQQQQNQVQPKLPAPPSP